MPEPPVLEHPLQHRVVVVRVADVAVRHAQRAAPGPQDEEAGERAERRGQRRVAGLLPAPQAHGSPSAFSTWQLCGSSWRARSSSRRAAAFVPEHLAVEEPELVPALPVQRLEVDRLRIELRAPWRDCPRPPRPRPTPGAPRSRAGSASARSSRTTRPARAGHARSASTRRRPVPPRSAARRSSRARPTRRARPRRPSRSRRPTRTGSRPAANRNPITNSERPGERDEVPVVVEEPVDEERGHDEPERQRRLALVALEPPERAPRPEQRRAHRADPEREPDDPRLGRELERQVVRLEHVHARVPELPVHDLERPGAGPAERLGREPVPRLLPPAPAVVEAALPEPARPLADRRRRRRADSRSPRRRRSPPRRTRSPRPRPRAAAAARAPAPAGSAGTTPPRTPRPHRARTRARTRRRRARARCAAARPARSRAGAARPRTRPRPERRRSTNAARLSNRSRVSANQPASATNAASTPPREYVSTSAIRSAYSPTTAPARTSRECRRLDAAHSAIGSPKTITSASAFQYPTGDRSRASRP